MRSSVCGANLIDDTGFTFHGEEDYCLRKKSNLEINSHSLKQDNKTSKNDIDVAAAGSNMLRHSVCEDDLGLPIKKKGSLSLKLYT